MIGLDTNVLVHFLVQDDPGQGAAARAAMARLSAEVPGFVGQIVLVELVWVLERAYRLPRIRIARALEGLLAAPEIVVEESDAVGLALDRYAQGEPGFANHLIMVMAARADCAQTLSFDRKIAGLPGVRLLG